MGDVLPVLDNLLSLEGLVTISIGSLISIRTLRIIWIRNDGNVSINGDNNIVIYNKENKSEQRSYRLLWSVLSLAIAFSYPLFSKNYNSVLAVSSILAIPISLAGVVASVKRFGFEGIWSLFYAFGAAVAWWIVMHSAPYLTFTAEQAAQFFGEVNATLPLVTTPLGYGESLFSRGEEVVPRVPQLACALLAIIGFAGIFLSTCYLAFGFFVGRHFDGAVRHTISYVVAALASYAALCNIPLAWYAGNLPYVRQVVITLFQSPF